MQLYSPAGWLGVGDMFPHLQTYTWIWGGRGIGKTYGFLRYVRYEQPLKFVLLRRTQTQLDLIRKPDMSPFKAVDRDIGRMTATLPLDKYTAAFYDAPDGEPVGTPVGYGLALSTLHNVRGIDLSDVDIVIYDEFVPEPHERPIKNEYLALLNALETIGRNRELQGGPPLRFVGLTNANQLGNPYFIGLGVVRQVDRMIKKGIEVWEDPQRQLMLINVLRSPISAAKANTSLYRLAGDGEFTAMSLGNQFAADRCTREGSMPLRELRPVVGVGELTIYRHKSQRTYYCTTHRSGTPEVYPADHAGLQLFRRRYRGLWLQMMDNNIVYQDIYCEILLRQYFGY